MSGFFLYEGTGASDVFDHRTGEDYEFNGYDGSDSLSAHSAADNGVIKGGGGDDYLYSLQTKRFYGYGGDGNDEIHAYRQEHVELHGGAGDDSLWIIRPFEGEGATGPALLYGDEGNDELVGGGGGILDGGAGNDAIRFSRDDKYVFGVGDGGDTLYFSSTSRPPRMVLTELHFKSGVSPSDVGWQPTPDNNSVEIVIGRRGLDWISIHLGADVTSRFYDSSSPYGIARVTFEDHPELVWTKSDLLSKRIFINPDDGVQRIVASTGSDLLNGMGAMTLSLDSLEPIAF